MELVADKEPLTSQVVFETFGVKLIDEDSTEGTKRLEGQVLATLKLSGTIIKVAIDDQADDPTIWIWTDECAEPVWMSPTEAKLLIASLQLAVHEATGKDA